jgi:hypothetical protein
VAVGSGYPEINPVILVASSAEVMRLFFVAADK